MEPKKGLATAILKGMKPTTVEPSADEPDVEGGAMAEGAQSLIDAVSSGSASSVAAAFKDLYELCASGADSSSDDFA